MTRSSITYLTDVVMITCIVSQGRGDEAIRVARDAGVAGALVYHARGSGVRERLGLLGVAVEVEKDVVTMITAIGLRDEVMRSLYTRLGLDRPGSGLIYATPIDKVATYIPEDVLDNLEQDTPK